VGAPRLRGCRWSDEFNDFLNRCLQKNPKDRATTVELLEHPFIAEAVTRLQECGGKSKVLAALAKEVMPLVEAARKEDAEIEEANEEEGAEEEEEAVAAEDEEEALPVKAATIRYADGTVIRGGTLRQYRGTFRGPAETEVEDTGAAHRVVGSFVRNPTIPSDPVAAVASGVAASVPSFLRDLRTSQLPDDPLEPVPASLLSQLSQAEISTRLAAAEAAFRTQLAALSERHAAATGPLREALGVGDDVPEAGGEDEEEDEEEDGDDDDGEYDDDGYALAGDDADTGVAGTFRYAPRAW
jgi:hypothetical protein